MRTRDARQDELVVDSIADLTGRLVRINSVNPALVPGAPGERPIADFVAAWLSERGISVTEVPSSSIADRPSVIGRVRGSRGGRALALYAHLDTVGVAGMQDPFDGVVRDGTLHGRGAWDMKGSLAAIMRVAATIARRPCAGDLVLMLVADEEAASGGAEAVVRELASSGSLPDGCIVAEPSGLELMLGHRGFATGRIVTRGRAAHTARRDQGVDAIAMMAQVIVAFEALDARMHAGPGHPLLGHSAVVVSLVRGGSELFTYPADCEAEFVWRTLPGQTRAELTEQVERVFDAVRERDSRFHATLEWRLWREPMLGDAQAPLAALVSRVAHEELGCRPAQCAAPWWTDAALIQATGIPSVIFGPPGGGIHAEDEWVEIEGLERFERILLSVTRSFCG